MLGSSSDFTDLQYSVNFGENTSEYLYIFGKFGFKLSSAFYILLQQLQITIIKQFAVKFRLFSYVMFACYFGFIKMNAKLSQIAFTNQHSNLVSSIKKSNIL